MTRRERLERKQQKREEWAAGRRDDAAARFRRAHQATEGIPLGQPILVGHHSERRHRAALARSDSNMRAGCESVDMAKHHESAAAGIERQLETSIFSDDPDAVEALEAKLAGLQADQERDKAINKAVRSVMKMNNPVLNLPECRINSLAVDLAAILHEPDADKARRLAAELLTPRDGHGVGIPSYVGSNRNGNIGRIRKRIEDIKRRQERTAEAEAAGGVTVTEGGDWCQVTFAEKPDREVINALKAAGFRWGGGSWCGPTAKLPEGVRP